MFFADAVYIVAYALGSLQGARADALQKFVEPFIRAAVFGKAGLDVFVGMAVRAAAGKEAVLEAVGAIARGKFGGDILVGAFDAVLITFGAQGIHARQISLVEIAMRVCYGHYDSRFFDGG